MLFSFQCNCLPLQCSCSPFKSSSLPLKATVLPFNAAVVPSNTAVLPFKAAGLVSCSSRHNTPYQASIAFPGQQQELGLSALKCETRHVMQNLPCCIAAPLANSSNSHVEMLVSCYYIACGLGQLHERPLTMHIMSCKDLCNFLRAHTRPLARTLNAKK